MIDQFNMEDIRKILNHNFPQLYESGLKTEIAELGTIKSIGEGVHLMDVGQYVKSIPLVSAGKLKIFREDEEGSELFLYYLHPGEACAISLAYPVNDRMSEVRAVAMEHTQIISIPIQYMDKFMMTYRSWQQFVVRTYGLRLHEMLQTIDRIAFMKMDERLLAYLHTSKAVSGKSILNNTHQNIAIELNTSREVISRLLKQMEKKGLVQLSRNHIEVLT
ncbi:MAG: CRP/FNR family transcriptional regulator [Salibacteraceae bacterium]